MRLHNRHALQASSLASPYHALFTPTATTAALVERYTPQRHGTMVVKSRKELPRSPSPFLKKKLAPSCPRLSDRLRYRRLSVPTMPLSRSIALPSLLFVHVVVPSSGSVRVFDRHRAVCSLPWESQEAPVAKGSLARSSF